MFTAPAASTVVTIVSTNHLPDPAPPAAARTASRSSSGVPQAGAPSVAPAAVGARRQRQTARSAALQEPIDHRVAVMRGRRLRMELHAHDRMLPVLHRHDGAVVHGARRHPQRRRQRRRRDDQRVIARHAQRRRQAHEHAGAVVRRQATSCRASGGCRGRCRPHTPRRCTDGRGTRPGSAWWSPSRLTTSVEMPASRGVHGPGEMMMWVGASASTSSIDFSSLRHTTASPPSS